MLRGWDRYTVGLVEALAARGVDVTLIHRAGAPVHPTHAARLDRPLLSISDRSGLSWEQWSLPRALRRGHFDLYHAPAEHGVPLWSPCPTVLTLHSATAYSYADLVRSGRLPGPLREYLGSDADPHRLSFTNVYWRAQVKRAGHVIAPSVFARDEIIRLLRLPPTDVTAIPLAVDRDFEKIPNDPSRRAAMLQRLGVRSPYLLYVGGYETHKNPAGLLDAFAMVRQTRPDLHLVMVGSRPPSTDLEARAVSRGLKPGADVFFLTGLGPDLPALYDGAELFVTLSWRESFGLPALEAMTRGIAVVASGWGAAPEVVHGGGILVDPRDPAAFQEAVIDLLRDGGRAARARDDARRFNWDAAAHATLAIYRRLIAR